MSKLTIRERHKRAADVRSASACSIQLDAAWAVLKLAWFLCPTWERDHFMGIVTRWPMKIRRLPKRERL